MRSQSSVDGLCLHCFMPAAWPPLCSHNGPPAGVSPFGWGQGLDRSLTSLCAAAACRQPSVRATRPYAALFGLGTCGPNAPGYRQWSCRPQPMGPWVQLWPRHFARSPLPAPTRVQVGTGATALGYPKDPRARPSASRNGQSSCNSGACLSTALRLFTVTFGRHSTPWQLLCTSLR